MKSLLLFLAVAFLVVESASSQADQLNEVDNQEIVELLNKLEIVASQDLYSNTALPMSIRIIRVRSDGECDGSPQSCPMQTVYLAISGHDEFPDRKVFELPNAYEWSFDAWERIPDGDGPDDYYVIRMTRKSPGSDPSRAWWQSETFRLRANLYNATLEQLP